MGEESLKRRLENVASQPKKKTKTGKSMLATPSPHRAKKTAKEDEKSEEEDEHMFNTTDSSDEDASSGDDSDSPTKRKSKKSRTKAKAGEDLDKPAIAPGAEDTVEHLDTPKVPKPSGKPADHKIQAGKDSGKLVTLPGAEGTGEHLDLLKVPKLNNEPEATNTSDELNLLQKKDQWQVNVWSVNLKTAADCSQHKQQDEGALTALCKNVLTEVEDWNLLDVSPRALKLLDAYADAEANPPRPTDVSPIQQQVFKIQRAEKATELARIQTLFYYSELSMTVESYEAQKWELNKGVGNKTACFNRYVEASCLPGVFATLDKKVIAKLRDPWVKRKEMGDRIRLLRRAFGDGIFLAMPPTVTASSFANWTVAKTKLLIHAMRSTPWANAFQKVVTANEDFVLQLMDGTTPAHQLRQAFLCSSQKTLEMDMQFLDESSDSVKDKLSEMIKKFPRHPSAVQLGCLGGRPEKRDMQTLRMGHDINDEIIRTILGLELSKMTEPRRFQVVDPSFISPVWNDVDRSLQIYDSTHQLLISLHHPIDGIFQKEEHWTLTEINLDEKHMYYYDSLFQERRFDRTVKILATLFRGTQWEGTDWHYFPGQVNPQKGRECGICVIATAVALMRGDTLPVDVQEGLRRFEYAKLITEKWWAGVIGLGL